jgi:nucleoid-associated protein YgaU
MNRYADIQALKTSSGIRYRGVTRYPEVPASESDIYVITTSGDRLDNLAFQFYGDSTLYWIIIAANPDQTYNLLYPVLGAQLRIPFPVQKIIGSFNTINNG